MMMMMMMKKGNVVSELENYLNNNILITCYHTIYR